MRVDQRAADREVRDPRHLRVPRARGHVGALIAGLRRQKHPARQPLPGELQHARERAGGGLHHAPARGDAGEDDAAHVDRELRARPDEHVGGERAIVGRAAGVDLIGATAPDDARVDIGEADAQPRPRGAQHDDWRGRGAVHARGDRAVLRRKGIRLDRERARRRVEPSAPVGNAELRRVEPEPAERHHAFGGIADVAAHDRVAAQETAYAAVEQLPGARDDAAGNAKTAISARHQPRIGGQVDDANALDPVIVDPPLERAGVAAGPDIGDDDRRGVDIVGADLKIVRQDVGHRDGEVAVDADVVRQPADGGVQPGHASRARRQGHEDAVGVHARQPLRIKLFDAHRAKRDALRAYLIVDGRRREGAVENDPRHHVAARQIGQDRARRQQPRVNREIAEAAVGEIEHAARVHGQRGRSELDPRVRLALIQRRVDRDVELGAGQPLDRPGQIQAGPRGSAHLDMPGARGDAEIGELSAAQRRQRAAVPSGPAALAADRDVERRGEAAHRRDDAADRRAQPCVDVELVVVRHRVEHEMQCVAARDVGGAQRGGVDGQLRAPVGDVCLAVDADDMLLARHRRGDDEAADVQLADVDIEIGQRRCVGIDRRGRRRQRGTALERHQLGRQVPDVDMVADEGEGAPVDRQPWRGQEHALGVRHAHVGQRHAAIERAIDPPDLDVEPRRGGVAAKLIGYEAPPRIGVDAQHDEQQQDQDRGDGDPQPAQEAQPERARGQRLHGVIGHQNA